MSIDRGRTKGAAEGAKALEALTGAIRRLAEGGSRDDALDAIAGATAAAAAAEVVVVRVLAEDGRWVEARAVSASSTSVAAELQGSRVEPSADGDALRSTGYRLGFDVALALPIALGGRELGRLELFRHAQSFTTEEETLGRLAAEHAAIALGGLGGNGKGVSPLPARDLLRLGGDALATGLDVQRTADEIARLAAQGSGAEGAVVWRLGDDLQPYVGGTFGTDGQDEREVVDALAARAPFAVTSSSWVLLLGQPPLGALQLRFEQPLVPSDDLLDALTTFAARARGDADRRREVGSPARLGGRAACRNGHRSRSRPAAPRSRGPDRTARRLSAQRTNADAGRARSGDRARRAARGRRPERAPPRAAEAARCRTA